MKYNGWSTVFWTKPNKPKYHRCQNWRMKRKRLARNAQIADSILNKIRANAVPYLPLPTTYIFVWILFVVLGHLFRLFLPSFCIHPCVCNVHVAYFVWFSSKISKCPNACGAPRVSICMHNAQVCSKMMSESRKMKKQQKIITKKTYENTILNKICSAI